MSDNANTVWLVIQEGGATGEFYANVYDTYIDAWTFRVDCAENGAYRTTLPTGIPAQLADDECFLKVAAWIAKDLENISYPESAEV
jgi:hypothetical protein